MCFWGSLLCCGREDSVWEELRVCDVRVQSIRSKLGEFRIRATWVSARLIELFSVLTSRKIRVPSITSTHISSNETQCILVKMLLCTRGLNEFYAFDLLISCSCFFFLFWRSYTKCTFFPSSSDCMKITSIHISCLTCLQLSWSQTVLFLLVSLKEQRFLMLVLSK